MHQTLSSTMTIRTVPREAKRTDVGNVSEDVTTSWLCGWGYLVWPDPGSAKAKVHPAKEGGSQAILSSEDSDKSTAATGGHNLTGEILHKDPRRQRTCGARWQNTEKRDRGLILASWYPLVLICR